MPTKKKTTTGRPVRSTTRPRRTRGTKASAAQEAAEANGSASGGVSANGSGPGPLPPAARPASRRQQREQRLRVMEKALVEGVQPEELLQLAPAQFGISPRQARGDLKEVLARLRAQGERILLGQHDPQSVALAVRRRERLYHEAVQHGDRRIALEAEKDRCRLLGIYPSDRTWQEHELDDATLDRTIEAELARLAHGSQAPAAGPAAETQRPQRPGGEPA